MMQRIGTFWVKLSRKVTWSKLAKLGTLPVVRLTALVPMLGLFLLFNQQTEVLFQFPEFLNEDIGRDDSSELSVSNLYFTYFGLCALGVASLLFSALCPQEIQDQPNKELFVAQASSTETPVLSKSNFRHLLELHHSHVRDEVSWENPEYPGELEGDFHSLMEEFYTKTDYGNEGSEGLPEIITGTGYLDFTEFANMLWMNQRVVWPITLPVFELAPQLAKDTAFVRFQALDYTRFRLRVAISAMYIFGFVLLIIPTLRVFLLLVYGFFVGW
ncbi:hypothetical protein [Marivita sp.]|uniref:hypothetical protein n=1 Tax=Marivita sp. TaxID=2003365 RepID=UPI003A893373